jgi:hypothetical protein
MTDAAQAAPTVAMTDTAHAVPEPTSAQAETTATMAEAAHAAPHPQTAQAATNATTRVVVNPPVAIALSTALLNKAISNGVKTQPNSIDSINFPLDCQVQDLKETQSRGPNKSTNVSIGGEQTRNNANRYRGLKPAWMSAKPRAGESGKKTLNDKVYWWCPKHNSWTRHSPDKCEGKGVNKSTTDTKPKADSPSTTDNNNNEKTLQLSKALATIVESS